MKSLGRLAEHFLITIPTMFGVAYFVLWACAPPSTLPPPVGVFTPPQAPGEKDVQFSGQVGIGVSAGSVGVEEAFDGSIQDEFTSSVPGGWGWLSGGVGAKSGATFELGLVGFKGVVKSQSISTVGGGGFLRVMGFNPESKFGVGLELQGGYPWGSIALPLSFQLSEFASFYTSPGVQFSEPGTFIQLPAGFSLHSPEGFLLNLQFGFTRGKDTDGGAADYRYSYGFAAASLGFRFGGFDKRVRAEEEPEPEYYVPIKHKPITPTSAASSPNTAPASMSAPSSQPASAPVTQPAASAPASNRCFSIARGVFVCGEPADQD